MKPSFLTSEVEATIKNYCCSIAKEEACGLILNDGTVIPAENIIEGSGLTDGDKSLDCSNGYLIDQDLIIEHEDNLACVFHSHFCEYNHEGYLSPTDIEQSRFHGIPYLLYHTAFDVWDYFDPNRFHPFPLLEKGNPQNINYYLKWPFVWGRSDCSSIIRAWMYHKLNHTIPDYPRPRDGANWYKDPNHENAYLKLLEDPANGFMQVDRAPRKDDVVLMRFFGSRLPAHGGVMVSDTTMLHVLEPGHQSEVVPFGGAWKRGLHSVWQLIR